MTESTDKKDNQPTKEQQKLINDFCITFSTVNGSGRATANTTLMRTFFKLGIPV